MASLDLQIADAVKVLAHRRLVFSVQDAAAYASLKDKKTPSALSWIGLPWTGVS